MKRNGCIIGMRLRCDYLYPPICISTLLFFRGSHVFARARIFPSSRFCFVHHSDLIPVPPVFQTTKKYNVFLHAISLPRNCWNFDSLSPPRRDRIGRKRQEIVPSRASEGASRVRTTTTRGSRKRKGCIIGGHLECDYLHPPSISIPLCGRGVLRCYVVETASSYYEERLYGTPNLLSLSFVIDDRFSTRAPIRKSAIFRAAFDT